MYSKIVMDHFKNPRNQGRMENPDGVGKVGNPTCGDVLWFYIKVKDGIIEDVKWETYGCAAAIAVSSIVSEMIKGKKIGDVLKIKNRDVLKGLGNLPPIKMPNTPRVHKYPFIHNDKPAGLTFQSISAA